MFDPDDVGVKDPVPFTELSNYTIVSPVRFAGKAGAYDIQTNVFNGSTTMKAVAFPSGTRSVLFFGVQGTGPYCYKDEGPESCRGTGGPHAPPYITQVWAFDANDYLAVLKGTKKKDAVEPYAIWQVTTPWPVSSDQYAGGTFDPATNRVFLIERNGESPNVRVFHIKTDN